GARVAAAEGGGARGAGGRRAAAARDPPPAVVVGPPPAPARSRPRRGRLLRRRRCALLPAPLPQRGTNSHPTRTQSVRNNPSPSPPAACSSQMLRSAALLPFALCLAAPARS